MNIIIYTLVFLGIAYFLLKLVANTSSKKISKHLRKLIFLGLIILAVLLCSCWQVFVKHTTNIAELSFS